MVSTQCKSSLIDNPALSMGGFSETLAHRPGLRRAIVGPILAQACAPSRRWPERRMLNVQLKSKYLNMMGHELINLGPNSKRSQNQSQEARGLLRRKSKRLSLVFPRSRLVTASSDLNRKRADVSIREFVRQIAAPNTDTTMHRATAAQSRSADKSQMSGKTRVATSTS